MTIAHRFLHTDFMIRLRSWEYWPFWAVHFPFLFYWLWLSAKARSLLFFTAANPGIPMGGMFGESKFEMIKKCPDQVVPASLLVLKNTGPREM